MTSKYCCVPEFLSWLRIGSQCNFLSIGVMCSNFDVFVTTRAECHIPLYSNMTNP